MIPERHGRRSNSSASLPIEHTYDEATPASIAVIQAIAAVEDVDPIDVEFTLFEHVQPDALDMLVGHDSATGNVEIKFTVDGYRVRVRDTGEVVVRDVDR